MCQGFTGSASAAGGNCHELIQHAGGGQRSQAGSGHVASQPVCPGDPVHVQVRACHPGQGGRRVRADILAIACSMGRGSQCWVSKSGSSYGHGGSLGACPTATARSRQQGHQGSPSPGHPWGWEQAEARQGRAGAGACPAQHHQSRG